MLEFIQYKSGTYVEGKDFTYKLNKKNSKDFLCLFLEHPSPAENARLSKEFNIPERYLKRYATDVRSVRYAFDPLIFSFTDYAAEEEDLVRISHMLFAVEKNVLVMCVAEKSAYYKVLFHHIIEAVKAKKIQKITHILYEFLHRDSKENYEVLEQMDDRISHIESDIINAKKSQNALLLEIMIFKKYLIGMKKRLWASSKIIFTLKKDLTSIKLDREEMALLDDIYDTLLHQIDMIETQKETVTDLLEIFTTTISNKLAATSNELNMVMKKMAALTIIIMIPTLIAGIYGMNFRHMPELVWYWGYGLILALMAVAAFLTYLGFHKKGWV